MPSRSQIAHFNVARLLHPPGDPRVAEFVDNTVRVNAVAARSKGYVWHLADESALVTTANYAGPTGDPKVAYSMSIWESFADFEFFVHKTLHGGFLRRRADWFEPWPGPNMVIWNYSGAPPLAVAEGWSRLKHLAEFGATEHAYDFAYAKAAAQAG